MDFSFTDDQTAFRDAVRDVLAKECTPEVVRSGYPEPPADRPGEGPGAGARAATDAIDRLRSTLGRMGVYGVAVTERLGGLGLAEVDWVLLAEESGYATIPLPFVESAFVAAPLLMETGYPTQGFGPRLMHADVQVAAELTGRGPLPWGAEADWSLLRLGDALHMVDRDTLLAAGERLATVDAGRAAVTCDRAALIASSVPLTTSAEQRARAFDRGVLGTAAQLIGLARRMLDLTVAYVVERRQFGVPIGSFQAVKHHLADARLRLEFAAPAVYAAAWALAEGQPDASRDVSVAKALASDAATLTGRKALQCHGAIGYTVEYDLHLYFKRAFALASSWGDAAWHRDRVGRSLGV